MKLRTKAIIVVGLTSILYLVSIIFLSNIYLSSLISLFITSSLITLLAIYTTIIKRVENLNREVSKATAKNNSSNIKMTGSDEVYSISEDVNKLLKSIQNFDHVTESRIQESSKALKEENTLLKQELSAIKRGDKLIDEQGYLKELGRHDNLTLLPNGIFFNEVLNKTITHAQRRNQHLAILLINLDLFKLVYDTFGQEYSNLVLKEIGKRFTNVLRKEDFIAKLEGDEFIVLLSDIAKPKFASTVAEKLLSVCSQILKFDSHEFTVTASIGISIYPNDGNSLEDLIENADRALFKAKQAGGNSYQFHTEEIQTEAIEYIQLEAALRNAILNNELTLYYQPKFRIKTGNITALEALMRWEHPTLGIINPAKIIQLAEESGHIMKIGEWALREVCQKIKSWQSQGYEHLTVALKLSPKQFHHPDMIKTLNKVFETTGVNSKYIELEITEKTVMDNIELSSNILDEMKATGVQISIDHFGKGYTSISYLKQFPISAIKIDQSYIKGIPNNVDDVAITSALIALGHKLGMEVVAEGVETAEQIQFLSLQGCDVVQGYFLSHPVPAQKIIQQFKKLDLFVEKT